MKKQTKRAKDAFLVELVRRAKVVKMKLDAAKALYDEYDALTMAIIKANDGFIGPVGVDAVIVDNFVSKDGEPRNVAFRASAIRRFELKFAGEK